MVRNAIGQKEDQPESSASNGEVLDIPVYAMGDHRDDAPELIDLLIKSSEEGPNPVETREMTEAEEAEHAAARS